MYPFILCISLPVHVVDKLVHDLVSILKIQLGFHCYKFLNLQDEHYFIILCFQLPAENVLFVKKRKIISASLFIDTERECIIYSLDQKLKYPLLHGCTKKLKNACS
jgi:hypothetical protein